MTTFKSVPEAAKAALEHFHVKKRDDGTHYSTADKKGASPDWLRDLCHDAHGGMMPDDYRYDMIHSALYTIADVDDDATEDDIREDSHGYADSAVSVYHSDRIQWLASHGLRQGYVDEAVEELGRPEGGISDEIAYGWYAEAEEVFGSVLQSLVDLVED